jgi:hypothetical protein
MNVTFSDGQKRETILDMVAMQLALAVDPRPTLHHFGISPDNLKKDELEILDALLKTQLPTPAVYDLDKQVAGWRGFLESVK